MKVCLYMRYSSDHQTEQSIEGQQRVCEDYCKREGHDIVAMYIDRATSAYHDVEKRIQFLKMIKDAEHGRFEGVVVYKLDRFSRNRYDSAIFKTKLKKFGVRVISATENISDNPEGVLLESVLEGMAEFYSKELAQKIQRGVYQSALKCHVISGRVPFGYKVVDKKYAIDEETAPYLKEIFNKYDNGISQKEIADWLNGIGVRTSRGAKWNKNSFHRILTNKRYIGIYEYQDIRIEGGVPQLISEEQFRRVGMKVKKSQSQNRGVKKVDYLLSGKLFCGHCGERMVGDMGHGKSGASYAYYRCKNSRKGCDKKTMRKDYLEDMVIHDVMNLLTPETIMKMAKMTVKAAQEEYEKNLDIPRLQSAITAVQLKIDNLVKFIENGLITDELVARAKALQEEREELIYQLDQCKNQVVLLEEDQVIWWLTSFCSGDIDDPGYRKHLIDVLVSSVTVWDNDDGGFKIRIAYNLEGGHNEPCRCSDIVTQRPSMYRHPNTLIRTENHPPR